MQEARLTRIPAHSNARRVNCRQAHLVAALMGDRARVTKRRMPCWWRIPEITRQWVSDRVRDSAAATGMNQRLVALVLHQALAVVLPSPSERDVD
jgi:hypothetical protein